MDGSDAFIEENFPQIGFVQKGYNSGWGVACNTGIRAAASDYVVLLNNDAYMEEDCVEEMVRAVESDPKYGSCASRILLWDERDKAEVCGLVIYRDGSSCGRGRLGPADQYMDVEEVFCANDCCSLYKRAMLQDIGDYDPDFFMYCDETDIGWRHQLAGWKCVYNPRAVAYHAHSQAAGSYSGFKAFYVERNRLFICFKVFPLRMLIASAYYSCYRFVYQWYLSTFKKKGALAHYRKHSSLSSGLWILMKAHVAAFVKLPVMLRRRFRILNRKKISNRDISDLFKRFGISARDMAGYE